MHRWKKIWGITTFTMYCLTTLPQKKNVQMLQVMPWMDVQPLFISLDVVEESFDQILKCFFQEMISVFISRWIIFIKVVQIQTKVNLMSNTYWTKTVIDCRIYSNLRTDQKAQTLMNLIKIFSNTLTKKTHLIFNPQARWLKEKQMLSFEKHVWWIN